MILVHSSVWIDLLNNVVTEPVRRLRELIPTTPLLIGDLILCEILQGFRTDAQARLVIAIEKLTVGLTCRIVRIGQGDCI